MIDANQRWDVERSDRARARARAASICGGSRSRRARTTCSGTRRSRRRCGRSASPPASTARTASSSSSCCRPGAIDFCQIDSCRLGGVNENLAVILMAAKFGVPVCPHAGGVGLCEFVQHLSMFDYIAVSGTMDDRVIEFVDHLHEHFVDPVRHSPRPLHGADAARLQQHDQARDRAPATRYPEGAVWRDCRRRRLR